MDRVTLRAQVRARRAARGSHPHLDAARLDHALALVGFAGTVAAHVSFGTEPSTAGLLAALADRGTRVLLPVLQADGDLRWAVWAPDEPLLSGLRGTSHPAGPLVPLSDADVVVAPALAVDVLGNRLGQGGGSYDRALPRRRPGVDVWAWLDDADVLASVPVKAWDVPVDGVVTPSGLRRLRPAPTA